MVWVTLELKQKQSEAVPEDTESLEMCTKRVQNDSRKQYPWGVASKLK